VRKYVRNYEACSRYASINNYELDSRVNGHPNYDHVWAKNRGQDQVVLE
jgi:hypothetical protein